MYQLEGRLKLGSSTSETFHSVDYKIIFQIKISQAEMSKPTDWIRGFKNVHELTQIGGGACLLDVLSFIVSIR